MAVNLCPGSPSIILCASPRISFSHDLDHHHHPSSDHVSRSDHNLLLPRLSSDDSDFEFRLPSLETSTADELFSGGMILPAEIKEPKPLPEISTQVQKETAEEEEDDDIIVTSTRAKLIREEKGNNSKSFWRFMRSSSLNYDSKKASIWSSLPLLARSNSTGSSPNSNTNTKQSSHGGSSTYKKSVKPHSSSPSNSNAGFPQKPPLGKSYSVVPPPYIAKGTSDLLGLGSLFRHGNERKGKKR